MLIQNLKLDWANLKKVNIKDVDGEDERKFAGEVKNFAQNLTIDVYICSDGRNTGVRQILNEIPYVNVFCSAGNVVYAPNERPSVIIAHGNSCYEKCGAVDHAGAGCAGKFLAIEKNVESDPIKNARAQLDVVSEEYRAGILYFNHEKCEIEDHTNDNEFAKTPLAKHLFNELQGSLIDRYTDQEKKSMAKGQQPKFIMLTNLHSSYTIFDIFRVDLQRNRFNEIVSDSVGYAMENALTGEGSFEKTKTAFFVFEKGRRLPDGLGNFLNEKKFIREYIKRGGNIYVITVGDMPSNKTIYRIDLK